MTERHQIPDWATVESDLRWAICLKADDLIYLHGGPEHAEWFLGLDLPEDLECWVDDIVDRLDINRHHISDQLRRLHGLLSTESTRTDHDEFYGELSGATEFLDQFISGLAPYPLFADRGTPLAMCGLNRGVLGDLLSTAQRVCAQLRQQLGIGC